jgi:formylglycine-generating enzyme
MLATLVLAIVVLVTLLVRQVFARGQRVRRGVVVLGRAGRHGWSGAITPFANLCLAATIGSIGPACTCNTDAETDRGSAVDVPVASGSDPPVAASSAAPRVLFVPDAAAVVATGLPAPMPRRSTVCPADMVSVRGQFCIDRYESVLVDTEEARDVSPYYHPTFFHTKSAYTTWNRLRAEMGTPEVQLIPLPEPPSFQLQGKFEVRSVVRRGVMPNGYVSGNLAERACRNAHKRLCNEEEWVIACRGEADRQFPYGDTYEPRKCNVFNGVHPALILHGDASSGHLDPRLNHFEHKGASLLHTTGANPECASRWGEDAVYDMVGNLDEWVDDDEGVFLGGFYARNTREGCLSRVSAHPRGYFDYSLGIRCCQ